MDPSPAGTPPYADRQEDGPPPCDESTSRPRTVWANDALWLLDRILPGLLAPRATRSPAALAGRLALGAVLASALLAAALAIVLIPATSHLQRAYLADGIGPAELAKHEGYRADRDLLISSGFLGLAMYGLLPNFAILLKTKALMRTIRARYPRLARRQTLAMLILDLFASGLVYLALFPLNLALFHAGGWLSHRLGPHAAGGSGVIAAAAADARDAYAALFDGAYALGDRDWAVSLAIDAALLSWLAVWVFGLLGAVLGEAPLGRRREIDVSPRPPG